MTPLSPLGKTHLSILSGETSLGCLRVGVLLLDVSVKMEIIDFPQQRIKQNEVATEPVPAH